MSSATLLEAKLERLRQLKGLQAELKRLKDIEDGAIKRPWREVARPEQIAPPGDWMTWLILAGRGWGKSRTAAEWAAERGRRYPGSRIALVGKTFADTRDTMLEGESGLIACFNRDEFRNHSEDDGYNRSIGEVRLFNGTHYKTYSAEKPWRLRGPQFNAAWCDEAAFWQDANKGLTADTTWSNLVITLRLPKRPEWDEEYKPQIVVATTPRPVALLKTSDPDPSRTGLMQRETTIITRGRTVENLGNLSEAYKENVIAPLLGTRLGRQELDAEILDDNEAALWRRQWIDNNRVTDMAQMPDLIRIVVGVDPAVTDGETSAQTGIIVAGASRNGHGYVLGDYTLRATPMEAMKKVVQAYHDFNADRVVAEVNNGGDYIGTLVKTVDPDVPYQSVRATRGKALRAEPISSLYEQNRIHHVGMFPYLEDSQCGWTPLDAESPDRLDACLAGGTMVFAERGEVPIEDIIPGERVWTRRGWKKVLASRCTHRDAETMTLQLSNGRSLTGTADHKVATADGWKRLDEVSQFDKLVGWTFQQKSSTTALCIAGTREIITFPLAGTNLIDFIAKFGEISITDKTFRQVIISIMQTSITSTMNQTTSNFSVPVNTLPHMACSGEWAMSVPIFGPGIHNNLNVNASRVANNSRHFFQPHRFAQSNAGQTVTNAKYVMFSFGVQRERVRENVDLSSMANSQASSFRVQCVEITSVVSRQRIMERKRVLGSVGMRSAVIHSPKMSSARYADSCFTRKNTGTSPAHVSVVGSSVNKKRQPVYDLMVETAHEFLANGVVVHNCVWALHSLRDLIGGSFLSAYGVIRCESCQHAFTVSDPNTKKPRTACPKCAAPIESSE